MFRIFVFWSFDIVSANFIKSGDIRISNLFISRCATLPIQHSLCQAS